MFKCIQSTCSTVRNENGILHRLNSIKNCKTPSRCHRGKPEDRFKIPARYRTALESVWAQYDELATKIQPAVNLAQGFPDFNPPKHVTTFLGDVSGRDNPLIHQYTRSFGHPRLVTALAKLYSPLICKDLNPMTEIMVTYGAFEAVYTAILGHVQGGDEVILLEPYFDCYDFMIRSAHGVPRFVVMQPDTTHTPITSSNWTFNTKTLEAAFNPCTKMIILNNPHNPLGKVFTLEELEFIASLCKKHNVLCLADEASEWMVMDPNKKHIKIASLPGMWERTITIGSAGKTFSVTGWRTGWAYGSSSLMENLRVVHQNSVHACNTPIQEALALSFEHELKILDNPECYLRSLARDLLAKRDNLIRTLKVTGLQPVIPDAGYFIVADWSELAPKVDLLLEPDKYKDQRFTKRLVKESGVLGIPASVFYTEQHKLLAENLIRFCFIKKDETLGKASKLLKEWLDSKEKGSIKDT